MDALEAIRSRISVRKFDPTPLSRQELYKILDAARWAPSAGNLQCWEFILVEEEERKALVAEACLNQGWIAGAPTVVVVCADTERSALRYGERGKYFYSLLETSAAVENMLVAATSQGIGSCFAAGFDEAELARILDLPAAVTPIAVVPLGYPAEDGEHEHPERADLSNSVHFEEYGNYNPKEIPDAFRAPAKKPVKKGKRKGLLGIFA